MIVGKIIIRKKREAESTDHLGGVELVEFVG